MTGSRIQKRVKRMVSYNWELWQFYYLKSNHVKNHITIRRNGRKNENPIFDLYKWACVTNILQLLKVKKICFSWNFRPVRWKRANVTRTTITSLMFKLVRIPISHFNCIKECKSCYYLVSIGIEHFNKFFCRCIEHFQIQFTCERWATMQL